MNVQDYDQVPTQVQKKGRSSLLDSQNRNALLLKSAYMDGLSGLKTSQSSSKGGPYFSKRRGKRSKGGKGSLIAHPGKKSFGTINYIEKQGGLTSANTRASMVQNPPEALISYPNESRLPLNSVN